MEIFLHETSGQRAITHPPGASPLETLFPHHPILSSIICYLSSPALLALYCTSRTTRYYLHGQQRFFRSLVLVQQSEAEKWVEPVMRQGSKKDSAIVDPIHYWNTFIRELERTDRVWFRPQERVRLARGRMWHILKGHPLLPRILGLSAADQVELVEMRRAYDPKAYFASLMSRHLRAIVATLPVGRRLTTLVVDGSGVETEYMSILLCQIEGTLRGLSAKRCRNLECSLWSNWLLGALEETRPIGLQWLHIWGSGNCPTSDFDFTKQPIPLEPPDLDPDDPDCKVEDVNWKPNQDLFGRVIPMEFHLHYTIHLLPAMSYTLRERHSYLTSLRATITGQQNYRHRNPGSITPPFPLGDPHPLIAILATAKYCRISLDIAYCVCRRDCFSLLHGRPVWQRLDRPVERQGEVYVVNESTGKTYPVYISVDEEDAIDLHTHCVAEIGARRESGGTMCQNCGLWENELSPAEHRGPGMIKEYAGIKWGPAIGLGRLGVGDCCTDCVAELTCYGCKGFYCPSCCFRSILQPVLPPNPLAAKPPGTVFLKWICPQNLHGPFCNDCIESGDYFFTCNDCDDLICYGCHGPSGVTVSSALYTKEGWDSDNEDQRFGVVGNISEWEEGSYIGWGGLRSDVRDADKAKPEKGKENTFTRLQPSSPPPPPPPPSSFQTTISQPSSWEIPSSSHCSSHSSYDFEMDPEKFCRAPGELTSEDDTPSTTSGSVSITSAEGDTSDAAEDSSGEDEVLPDANEDSSEEDEKISDADGSEHESSSDASNDDLSSEVGSGVDTSWVARMMRMAETRIWETCARCGIGACAGCLGYEEDFVEIGTKHDRREEPEYRWCSGGCGKRFCDNCLNRRREGAGDLVCGGNWVDPNSETNSQDPLRKTFEMAGMPDVEPNDDEGYKERCGAVMCITCQEYELLLRPTICQAEGEIEVYDNKGKGKEGVRVGGGETERRLNDRRGIWRCDRCELGMPLRAF